MHDLGANQTIININDVKNKANQLDLDIRVGGRGYLFDQISNKLTKEVLIGLLLAILVIGLLFFVINNFNYRLFMVVLIPNILPLLVCIGLMSFFNFYFSLSNAFIFAIIFGLVVDDSIHIISSYSLSIKNGLSKNEAICNSLYVTARAVIKTTIIIIISLLPLLLSDFSSVFQLGLFTIISAIIALIFDLIYLPILMRKYL